MKLTRIFVICPDVGDATSFYRGVGPLGHLARSTGHSIQLMFSAQVSWATISMCDVVFMQRPWRAKDLSTAEVVKNCRLPLWLDYDDDLFSVPMENPSFDLYADEVTKKRIATMIAMADVVTVTTEQLKANLANLNKNIVVVPNAFDDRFLTMPEKREPPAKLVLWRGSDTHQKDLATVGMQLGELSHDPDLSDWTFQFMGFNPWWITERMRHLNTIISPPIDILEYHTYLREVNPALMFVPLCDSDFNLSKSNIAWIEGTYAGAAVVAPGIPEFVQPGISNYSTAQEFIDVMKTLMLDLSRKEVKQAESEFFIKQWLPLSRVNHLRLELLEKLLKRKL